jgi:hypothetical protein
LGVISAAREKASEESAAAGGLIAGSVIADIASGGLKGIVQTAKWRFIARVMESNLGHKWLTSGLNMPNLHGLTKAAILGSQTITRLKEEFVKDPDLLNQILEQLGLPPITGEDEVPDKSDPAKAWLDDQLKNPPAPAAPPAPPPAAGPGLMAAPPPPPASPAPSPVEPIASAPAAGLGMMAAQAPVERSISAGVAGKDPRTQALLRQLQNKDYSTFNDPMAMA